MYLLFLLVRLLSSQRYSGVLGGWGGGGGSDWFCLDGLVWLGLASFDLLCLEMKNTSKAAIDRLVGMTFSFCVKKGALRHA